MAKLLSGVAQRAEGFTVLFVQRGRVVQINGRGAEPFADVVDFLAKALVCGGSGQRLQLLGVVRDVVNFNFAGVGRPDDFFVTANAADLQRHALARIGIPEPRNPAGRLPFFSGKGDEENGIGWCGHLAWLVSIWWIRKDGGQTLAGERSRGLYFQEVQNRGKDIQGRYRRANHTAGRHGRRITHHEGHVGHWFVELSSVADVTVLAETFAVIGDDRDDGRVLQPQRVQRVQQLADVVVGIGNFAVVAVDSVRDFLAVLRGLVRGRRIGGEAREILVQYVGSMRIEIVHPQEEGTVAMLRHPRDGLGVHVLGRAIRIEHLVPAVEVLVVQLEARSETGEARFQRPRADECSRLISTRAQVLCEGNQPRVIVFGLSVYLGAVLLRGMAGEQTYVRGAGHGDHRVSAGETRSLVSKLVEARGGQQVIAVAGKMIRAKGVDGNQYDVGRVRSGTRRGVQSCGAKRDRQKGANDPLPG